MNFLPNTYKIKPRKKLATTQKIIQTDKGADESAKLWRVDFEFENLA